MKRQDIEISGPYFKFSSPYGKAIESTYRDIWYVSRKLCADEMTTEIMKILGTTCLGEIINFRDQKDRYIISQTYPIQEFKSLEEAIEYLIENEGKIVFLS